jgi:hypothetical protein
VFGGDFGVFGVEINQQEEILWLEISAGFS